MCMRLYPQNRERMVGLIYSVSGVIYFIGPIIGASLYSLGEKMDHGSRKGGYAVVFLTCAITYILMGFTVKLVFPSEFES